MGQKENYREKENGNGRVKKIEIWEGKSCQMEKEQIKNNGKE